MHKFSDDRLLIRSRPSFSADWGDYVSFASHLRHRADTEGKDLLLVDTGDRVEGNGLYDGSEPKGKYTFDIIKHQSIDLLCTGNHELYKQNSSENELNKTVPYFKGHYLASNVDIIDPQTGTQEPLAARYKKFTTKNQGIRILAFGFLYDFHMNANNTIVQDVEDTVKEEWFQDAIRDRDVDLFVVIGHVGIRSHEYDVLYKTIRAVQWDTPIQFFGGHTHIRDYKVYDQKATALESGRYMETIGFMSISGLNAPGSSASDRSSQSRSFKFSRRYIDNNLFSLQHHARKESSVFSTEHGRNVSDFIFAARKALSLDHRHGCAPTDFWVNRAPYPSEQSIFTWLENEVLPSTIKDKSRQDKPALVITNTGAIRFDIFKGPFTRDTTFLVSPFTSGFRYVKDVPYGAAAKLLEVLNSNGPTASAFSSGSPDELQAEAPQLPKQQPFFSKDIQNMSSPQWEAFDADTQIHIGGDRVLTPGYTTVDDGGADGDDTVHSQIDFYTVPNVFQATVGYLSSDDDSKPDSVDVVYNEFIQPWLLLALRFLGLEYYEDDTGPYMEGQTMTTVMTDWVEENWKC